MPNEHEIHYQTLGLNSNATWLEIAEAFQKLNSEYNPLANPTPPRGMTKQQQKKKYHEIVVAFRVLKSIHQYGGSNPEVKEYICGGCGKRHVLNEFYRTSHEHWGEKWVKEGQVAKNSRVFFCSEKCGEGYKNCFICGKDKFQVQEFKKSGNQSHELFYCLPCYEKAQESCANCEKKFAEGGTRFEEGGAETFCSENCAREWEKIQKTKNPKVKTNFQMKCSHCSKIFTYLTEKENKDLAQQELEKQLEEHRASEHSEEAPETTPPSISEEPSNIPDKDNSNGNEPNQNDNSQKISTARNQAWQNIKEILKKYSMNDEELKELKELKESSWQEYLQSLSSEEEINELVKKIEVGAKRISAEKTGSQNPNWLKGKFPVILFIGVIIIGGVAVAYWLIRKFTNQ